MNVTQKRLAIGAFVAATKGDSGGMFGRLVAVEDDEALRDVVRIARAVADAAQAVRKQRAIA